MAYETSNPLRFGGDDDAEAYITSDYNVPVTALNVNSVPYQNLVPQVLPALASDSEALPGFELTPAGTLKVLRTGLYRLTYGLTMTINTNGKPVSVYGVIRNLTTNTTLKGVYPNQGGSSSFTHSTGDNFRLIVISAGAELRLEVTVQLGDGVTLDPGETVVVTGFDASLIPLVTD